jgi:hypothetical protein
MTPRKNASKTRGKPFQPGNPGRPKGARHKTTLAIETLLDGEAESLTRKAIEMAKGGDITALRLCLDRIAPARKDRTIAFELPPVSTVADIVIASGALLLAVAEGDLTPSEAGELSKLLDGHRLAMTTAELEARIAKLEVGQRSNQSKTPDLSGPKHPRHSLHIERC